MNSTKAKQVALLIESSRSYGRRVLQGISRYAQLTGNWSLWHQEMTMGDAAGEWIRKAPIDGVIARVDTHNTAGLAELSLPIVDVLCSRNGLGVPQVETDDREVARLAFEHLHERGFRRFAFCGYRGAHYSNVRLQHFRTFAETYNYPFAVYESDSLAEQPLAIVERQGALDMNPLANWLRTLQRPCGVMVCHDIRGQQLLNLCRDLQIHVPDDLGVIGVDDDDIICPLSQPSLTSIRPDAEGVGFLAARVLNEMMINRVIESRIEHVPPIRVVQRESTQVMAVNDVEIARVCRFIRENACRGVNVNGVVEFSGISRRKLERRFRDEMNSTPKQEIVNVQIRRVKQLLLETDLSLEQIAPLAGYNHTESMSAAFKRETGVTPGAWRSEACTDPAP